MATQASPPRRATATRRTAAAPAANSTAGTRRSSTPSPGTASKAPLLTGLVIFGGGFLLAGRVPVTERERQLSGRAKERLEPVKQHALESLEEHHIVEWVASELDGMKPDAERFRAKVTVLIENVRHHIEEEEGELFPQVRQALGRKALAEIGEALEKAKLVAPTRPHPRAPDTPPGNLAAGAEGLIDRARDATGSASGPSYWCRLRTPA